jgi:hypothetical protein
MIRSRKTALCTGLIACACQSESPPEPGSHTEDLHSERWTGKVPNEGFGVALAAAGGTIWAGAPHGGIGRIYCLDDSGVTEVLSLDGRLGSSLAAWGDGFIAGAPHSGGGTGSVVDSEGAQLSQGPQSLGLALWSDEARWVAAHSEGWLDSDGQSGDTTHRPASVTVMGATVGLGSPLSDAALILPDTEYERTEELDFGGYALAAADIDADGEPEWIVGAPGANRVEIRSATGDVEGTLQSDHGRFGASLAAGDLDGDGIPELIVGAPDSGDGIEGSVMVYAGGSLALLETWTGAQPGAQLGTAVLVHEGSIVISSPGSADQLGSIQRVRLDP